MKLISLLFALLLSLPAYAGGRHHHHPPQEPPVQNVTVNNDRNNNGLILGLVIAAGVCIYHKCWQQSPVKDPNPSRITPDLPPDDLRMTPR